MDDRRDAADQPVVHEGAGGEATDRQQHDQAELLRREAEMVLQDEGNARQHAEVDGEGEAQGQHVAEELPLAQHLARAAQQAAEMQAIAAVLVGLRKAEQRDRQQQRAEAADEPEGRPPARPFAQKAAQGRRQRRRDVLAERDPAHDQRHLLEGVGVARHRAADHRAGSGTQSLQDAQGDEPADRRREGTGEGRDGEEDQSAQQHRPAAEAVAERPVEELADGEAQHVGGERELDAVGAGAERRADRGHHRRVDAHGQRAEAAQRHQQGDVAEGTRSETHFLAASAAPSAPKSPPSCRQASPPERASCGGSSAERRSGSRRTGCRRRHRDRRDTPCVAGRRDRTGDRSNRWRRPIRAA